LLTQTEANLRLAARQEKSASVDMQLPNFGNWVQCKAAPMHGVQQRLPQFATRALGR
jgi:hypothetical protein